MHGARCAGCSHVCVMSHDLPFAQCVCVLNLASCSWWLVYGSFFPAQYASFFMIVFKSCRFCSYFSVLHLAVFFISTIECTFVTCNLAWCPLCHDVVCDALGIPTWDRYWGSWSTVSLHTYHHMVIELSRTHCPCTNWHGNIVPAPCALDRMSVHNCLWT